MRLRGIHLQSPNYEGHAPCTGDVRCPPTHPLPACLRPRRSPTVQPSVTCRTPQDTWRTLRKLLFLCGAPSFLVHSVRLHNKNFSVNKTLKAKRNVLREIISSQIAPRTPSPHKLLPAFSYNSRHIRKNWFCHTALLFAKRKVTPAKARLSTSVAVLALVQQNIAYKNHCKCGFLVQKAIISYFVTCDVTL